MNVRRALWALLVCLLSGCAAVDPDTARDIARRRAITTDLLQLVTDISQAGGTIESMRRGLDSASFRVTVEPSKAPAVASALQSADILGKGALQQKTDPDTGRTIIIAGAGLEQPQSKLQSSFTPVAGSQWERQLEVANSIGMEQKLYFRRFFPVATESVRSLTRVRVEVIVSGTPEHLQHWADQMHATPGSSLLLDNITLERRADDRYGLRLTGDLFVYRN